MFRNRTEIYGSTYWADSRIQPTSARARAEIGITIFLSRLCKATISERVSDALNGGCRSIQTLAKNACFNKIVFIFKKKLSFRRALFSYPLTRMITSIPRMSKCDGNPDNV